ncbi:MAG: hypothetical protein Q7I91_07765 [Moraxellaceae bacterium]|nr:hypothetical protein [Moraxellaceae bacterium]
MYAEGITPGMCVGYMPLLTAHESKQIADNGPPSEHAGTVYLLRIREVRERGELFTKQADQFKRLQQRDFKSDFDADRQYAASIANQHILALKKGNTDQYRQVFQQYRSVDQACSNLLTRVRNQSSGSAFEALMKSMGN